MKTVYIPKGEIVRYESLMTEHLVVHGCLQVSNGIKARTITGQGTISAGTIDADVIRVDDVEAGSIVCKRLLAKRVQSPEVFASESATVSCFLSAAYVETGRLTVTLSEIDEVKAEEVVNLTPKKRTLFGTLLASLLRSFWIALTVHGQKEPTVMTDACEAMPEGVTESTQEETQEPEAEQAAPCEEENAVEPDGSTAVLIKECKPIESNAPAGYTLAVEIVALPSSIRVCALPSHTSVPCDRPEIRIRSENDCGFVSRSIWITKSVPNSGTPRHPSGQPPMSSGLMPSASVLLNSDMTSGLSSGIVCASRCVISSSIRIMVGSSCPRISSFRRFPSME